ncbi:uncharacterized protein LOC144995114 [Oryzias latipes]
MNNECWWTWRTLKEKKAYARYFSFSVGPEVERYKLEVTGFTDGGAEESSREDTSMESPIPQDNLSQTSDGDRTFSQSDFEGDLEFYNTMSPDNSYSDEQTDEHSLDSPTPREYPFGPSDSDRTDSEEDNSSDSDSEDFQEDSTSVESDGETDVNDLDGLISQRNKLKSCLAKREKNIAKKLNLIKKYEQEALKAQEDWMFSEKSIELERHIRQESRKDIRELEEKIQNVTEFLKGEKKPSYSEGYKTVLEETEMVTKQLLKINSLNLQMEDQIGKQKEKRETLETQLVEMVFLSNSATNRISNQTETVVCAPQQKASSQTEFNRPESASGLNQKTDSACFQSQKSILTIGAAPKKTTNGRRKNQTISPKAKPDVSSQLLHTLKVNPPHQFSWVPSEEAAVKVSSQAKSSGCAPQEKSCEQQSSFTKKDSASDKLKASLLLEPQRTIFTIGAAPKKTTNRRKNQTICPKAKPDASSQLLDTLKVNPPHQFSWVPSEEAAVKVSRKTCSNN